MEKRIDILIKKKGKRNGISGILMISILIMAVSLLISCGDKPEEGKGAEADSDIQGNLTSSNDSPDEGMQDAGDLNEASEGGEPEGNGAENPKAEQDFNYNHEYNEMLRCYEGDVYLAREDGIRRVKDGEGEEELIYENSYRARRGMELYQNYLYFCGSVSKEGQEAATVYRMDLNTLAVEDMLADISTQFDLLYRVSIYESNLYVARDYGARIGFELNEKGEITGWLDDKADDFLYREYNDYMELEWQKMNARSDDAYWEMVEETGKRYQAIMDVAACREMLEGNQVVSQYKDELLRSLFLEKEDGTYEYLCDMADYPVIVTETGIYYGANEGGDIWYVDYNTKEARLFFEKDADAWAEILLANYDADYVYLLESRYLGTESQGFPEMERELIRVPRQGGAGETVYRFEEGFNTVGGTGFYMHCGVYDKRMYFEEHETIGLLQNADEKSAKPTKEEG